MTLRKAAQRGVPHTVEILAMRLGMPLSLPDAETEQ
jgi:hypothetical protein